MPLVVSFSGLVLTVTPTPQGIKLPWRKPVSVHGDQPSAVCIRLREGLVSIQCQAGQQPFHITVVIAAKFVDVCHADLQRNPRHAGRVSGWSGRPQPVLVLQAVGVGLISDRYCIHTRPVDIQDRVIVTICILSPCTTGQH